MCQMFWTGPLLLCQLHEPAKVNRYAGRWSPRRKHSCQKSDAKSFSDARHSVCLRFCLISSWAEGQCLEASVSQVSPALVTWPVLKAMHACLCICAVRVHQGVISKIWKIYRCSWKDKGKGWDGDGKEGGFRNESGRDFGVPVTWLECRAPHSNGCVIRSGTETEDFLPSALR